MKALTSISQNDWNRLLEQESSFSMLQSWEWGAFKQRLGWKAFRVGIEDSGALRAGAQMLVRPLPLGLSLAYVPRGPVGNWLDAEAAQLLLGELARLAQANGAVFLKVEPPAAVNTEAGKLLESCGFQHSRVNNQPQATIILDLCGGPPAVLQNMRKKTRQYVHRAQREGITVRFGNSNDLPAYYELMRATAKREEFAARSLPYYQSEWEAFAAAGRAALLLAYHQDRLVAARMVYRFGAYAAEFHAGSLIVPGIHPNYLLVWEGIQWAMAGGCKTYDFWGIPDEIAEAGAGEEPPAGQREDGLWGVYQFKRGFSTNVVSYAGAYDRAFVPGLYRIFNLVLSWGKWWERIASMLDAPAFGHFPKTKTAVPGGRP